MIKAIIFDFSGVIMTWDRKAVYKKHETSRGLPTDALLNTLEDYRKGAEVGEHDNVIEFHAKTNPAITLTAEELHDIFQEAVATVRIDTEMIGYIEALKKDYTIAILSNFPSGLESLLRDTLNINHLFDVVMNSHSVKMKKPDPAIYTHMLEKLGVNPEEAVFIDDKEKNVEVAKSLGINGIVFENAKQFHNDLKEIINA